MISSDVKDGDTRAGLDTDDKSLGAVIPGVYLAQRFPIGKYVAVTVSHSEPPFPYVCFLADSSFVRCFSGVA